MRVDLFDFTLPPKRIATEPASPRDAARLLHVTPDGLGDLHVHNLTSLLRPGDMMVFNDTRVIPARLHGKRGEVSVEVLLHKELDGPFWQVFARPGKRLKVGDEVVFGAELKATVHAKAEDGQVTLRFHAPDRDQFYHRLIEYGEIPLPPYIDRSDGLRPSDCEDYQTIYARHEGSVAAPTAGLHFTDLLLDAIRAMGVGLAFVTLHVGGGTFLPVKSDDTADHVMHAEWGQISAPVAERIRTAKEQGGRIIAVGTTSLRLLESAARGDGTVQPFMGETDIFITPGYRFRAVDCLMTNFHLPKSTLFMLVSAFCGLNRMQAAYAHAIAQEYRFYSYGDASFLERCEEDAG